MTSVDPSSIAPTLVVSMTIIIAVVVVTATAILIAGQRAIRRMIQRARHIQPPEYWRMYARACDARCADRRVPTDGDMGGGAA